MAQTTGELKLLMGSVFYRPIRINYFLGFKAMDQPDHVTKFL